MPTPLDAVVARLRTGVSSGRRFEIVVDPADVQAVLDALERLRPAPRPPRLENLVALRSATNPRTKTEIPAAHCPDDNTNMRCLATRRPEPGMVRRRWECPRCKKRFTSYTHEKE